MKDVRVKMLMAEVMEEIFRCDSEAARPDREISYSMSVLLAEIVHLWVMGLVMLHDEDGDEAMQSLATFLNEVCVPRLLDEEKFTETLDDGMGEVRIQ